MIAFICLFFPSVSSVWLYESLTKSRLERRRWLYLYTVDVMLVNLFCFLVKRFVLQTGGEAFFSLFTDTTPAAAANYLIMAIPAALILAAVQSLLRGRVSIAVEERDAKE